MIHRATLRSCTLLIAAAATFAQAADLKAIDVSLPQQPLTTALVDLAKQTGCQFFASEERLRGFTASSVQGHLTVEQALEALLRGTGLVYGVAGGSCTFYIDSAPRSTAVIGDTEIRTERVAHVVAADSTAAVLSDKAPDSPAPSGAAAAAEPLSEVLVTASRRTVALADVPASLQVMTGDALEQLGARDFADYLGQVSGVSFSGMGTSGGKVTMRGLATTNFSESQATVGIYVDETPVTDAGGAPAAFLPAFNLKLIDVNRIEVLKGPQGTVFGAGALGGAIRIITNQPDATRFGGSLGSTLSSTQDGGINGEVSATVNAPIIDDKLAVRATGYYVRNDGFIDNEHPLRQIEDIDDEKTLGGRVAIAYAATDKFKVTGSAQFQRMERGGSPVETIDAGDLVQLRASPEDFSDDANLFNVVAEYEAPFATVLFSSSYYERQTEVPFDITAEIGFLFPGYFVQQNSDTDAHETSNELRFVSDDSGRFRWLGGVYWFDQQRTFAQGIRDIPGAANPLYKSEQKASFKELAFFGEVSYDLTSQLTATVGLRSFSNDIDFRSTQSGFFNGGLTNISGDGSDSDVTPKFNVSYKFDSGNLLYAAATRGYRRGGVNAVAPNALCADDIVDAGYPNGVPQTFGPDTVWNYEVGTRADWAEGRVQANAAVYYVDWTDLPVGITLPCSVTFNVNAGKARTRGTELQLAVQPTDALTLTGTFTYADAELQADVPAIGASSGDRAPTVPRITSSLATTYSFPIGTFSGFVNADANYVGSTINNYNPETASKLPDYTIGNARAGVKRDGWVFEAFVRNLWNERAQLGRFDQGFANFIVVNQPRTVGVQMRYDW